MSIEIRTVETYHLGKMVVVAATPVSLCRILEKWQKKSWISRNQNQPLSETVSLCKWPEIWQVSRHPKPGHKACTLSHYRWRWIFEKTMMTLLLENFQLSSEKLHMKLLFCAGKSHHHPVLICWQVDHQGPANLCCFFSVCSTKHSWSCRPALLFLLYACECMGVRGDPEACLPKSCKKTVRKSSVALPQQWKVTLLWWRPAFRLCLLCCTEHVGFSSIEKLVLYFGHEEREYSTFQICIASAFPSLYPGDWWLRICLHPAGILLLTLPHRRSKRSSLTTSALEPHEVSGMWKLSSKPCFETTPLLLQCCLISLLPVLLLWQWKDEVMEYWEPTILSPPSPSFPCLVQLQRCQCPFGWACCATNSCGPWGSP